MPREYTKFERVSGFFQKCKFACVKAIRCTRIVKPCPLLGVFRGHAPTRKLGNLARFGLYSDQILCYITLTNYHFYMNKL